MRELVNRIIWRGVIRPLARARGFPDPAALLAQVSRFAQPSSQLVPTEILRLGLLLQARGLLNSQAFQHNLDWIWPYWVERQFNPRSPSFVPRAFSVTHINLTHRNWMALGVPGCGHLPIVDPRGLITPHFDGWSIDGWVVTGDGESLVPSRALECAQSIDLSGGLAVRSLTRSEHLELAADVHVDPNGASPACCVRFDAAASRPAWLVVALRPCNPEGLSLVHDLALAERDRGWIVNGSRVVRWREAPDGFLLSCYQEGDVFHRLTAGGEEAERHAIHCPVGMATGAALFRVGPESRRQVHVEIPLDTQERARGPAQGVAAQTLWQAALDGSAGLQVPERRMAFLFQMALRTLVLHTPGDVYAGPYTYKRFWFRDAVHVAHALMCTGLLARARRIVDSFARRQDRAGYFHSQEGEWDANGQVLWAYGRYCALSGESPDERWIEAAVRGAEWIRHSRVRNGGRPHYGLMPAGFSAEHLGTNDFYYWDDFWSVAGLQAVADLLGASGRSRAAARYRSEAEDLLQAVEGSLRYVRSRLQHLGVPASPYRRMDSAAVGSLAAGYPLQIWPPDDSRLHATAGYLVGRHVVNDALFHDIAHSGLNPYLTLQLAQVLLRARDPRFECLLRGAAALASPTGQWPEAVHPALGTGCMGDGEHAWAAAEWLMMIRNCFVREEGDPPRLVLCSGLAAGWLDADRIGFGPAPTRFGDVTITVRRDLDRLVVQWTGRWRELPSYVHVLPTGYRAALVDPRVGEVRLAPAEGLG